ncbi:MAG: hypothetical protein ACTJFR_08100 [Canibacter sp.]
MSVLGGGVLFVAAAVLWCAVLIPSYIRRREYQTAEVNAAKLQRTIRKFVVAANESEEAQMVADARDALSREQILNSQQKREAADLNAELAKARAEQAQAEMRAKQAERQRIARERLAKLQRPAARTARAFAALLLVAGILGALVGVGLAIAGMGAGILLVSLVVAGGSLGGLVLLAPGRVKVPEIAAEMHVEKTAAQVIEAETEEEPEYFEQSFTQEHRVSQIQAAQRIARARAMARARNVNQVRDNQPDSMLLAEARAQVRAARIAQRLEHTSEKPAAQQVSESDANTAQRQSAVARLRQMGVVGDTSDGAVDLDAAIRRRRNAG